jgi:hypothetical protein
MEPKDENNNYFEVIKKDKSFYDYSRAIQDMTRENWKPFGNYRSHNEEEIARKAKRL